MSDLIVERRCDLAISKVKCSGASASAGGQPVERVRETDDHGDLRCCGMARTPHCVTRRPCANKQAKLLASVVRKVATRDIASIEPAAVGGPAGAQQRAGLVEAVGAGDQQHERTVGSSWPREVGAMAVGAAVAAGGGRRRGRAEVNGSVDSARLRPRGRIPPAPPRPVARSGPASARRRGRRSDYSAAVVGDCAYIAEGAITAAVDAIGGWRQGLRSLAPARPESGWAPRRWRRAIIEHQAAAPRRGSVANTWAVGRPGGTVVVAAAAQHRIMMAAIGSSWIRANREGEDRDRRAPAA